MFRRSTFFKKRGSPSHRGDLRGGGLPHVRSFPRAIALAICLYAGLQCLQDFENSGYLEAGGAMLAISGQEFQFSSLPDRMTLNIPTTVSASTLSLSLFTAGFSTKRSRMAENEPDFSGYARLKGIIDVMKLTALEAQFETMLIDNLLTQAGDQIRASATCIPGGTYRVVYTTQMRNVMRAAIANIGFASSAADTIVTQLEQQGILPRAGTELPSPALLYAANQGGYDSQLRYGYPDGFSAEGACGASDVNLTETFRWNADRQKYQYAYKESFDGETFSGIFTVDFTNSVMVYQNNFNAPNENPSPPPANDQFKETILLSACSTGSRCVKVRAVESFTGYDPDAMAALSFTYTVEGKADDNGGYVLSTFNEVGEPAYYLREYFGSDSTHQGAQESFDGVNFTTLTGFEDFDYGADEYDDDAVFDGNIPTVNNGTLAGSLGCSDCDFVILESGIDPNDFPEDILGAGEEYDSTLSVSYWGDSSLEGSLQVWELTGFDGNGEPIFSSIAGTVQFN